MPAIHPSRRPFKWLALALVVAAGLLAGLAAVGFAAQEQPEAADPEKIQPGELLILSIDSLVAPGQESRFSRRVGAKGEIWLPILDEQPLTAAGLTPGQLQSEIRRSLARKNYRVEIIAVARANLGEDQHLLVPQESPPAAARRQ